MPRARRPAIELTDAVVEEAAERVRRERFVPKTKLVSGKLSRPDEVLLIERLAARGFERTGRGVRVALLEQLRGALGTTERVTLAELAARVSGATRTEVKREALELVRKNELVLVPAARGDALTKPGPHVLSSDEIESARDVVQVLGKLLGRAKPRKGAPRRTLERAEVRALLAPLRALTEQERTATTTSRVLETVTELARQRGRSVFIPDVLRALGAAGAEQRLAAHAALFELARAGRVELRPESGVGNLSETDRALCPNSTEGLVISYARVLDAGGSP